MVIAEGEEVGLPGMGGDDKVHRAWFLLVKGLMDPSYSGFSGLRPSRQQKGARTGHGVFAGFRRPGFAGCLVACATLLSCGRPRSQDEPVAVSNEFHNPQRVTIEGYDGDAMEPFLTRDGKILFFNNLNEGKVNTNLHWAERVDDLHFKYRGEVEGVNTAALEGVASMDGGGNFYFVSNRSYDKTASTLYRGKFDAGRVTGIELVPGVSVAKPGIMNFDAEISADGDTLYFVESQFNFMHQPRSARILFARRVGKTFVRDARSEAVMKTINRGKLNYAPATGPGEREIFFTRVGSDGPVTYTAKRADKSLPFGEPQRIGAVTGFAEAPTLSPDGEALYFHKRDAGRFVIYRITR